MFNIENPIKFDPVSLAEIADLIGTTRQKVASLKFHGKLPDPVKTLKCGPLWDQNEILDFVETVGFKDNRKK